MTNPNDPRTPQERAYALDEPARRSDTPDDTRPFEDTVSDNSVSDDAVSDHSTRVLHTADPTEAYGRPVSNPTLVYAPYDLDPRAGGEYHPTQAYPVQGAYPGPQHYPGYAHPPGAPPTGPVPTSGPGGSPRGPRWGLIALASAVLIALGGTIGFLLSRSEAPTGATASAPTTTVAPPAPVPPLPDAQTPSLPLDRLPGGLGEVMGDTGAVVGTITANDGTSIGVSIIGGSTVTVLLTPDTSIVALGGSTPESLEVGASVVATGSPVRQGQMTAETVISASIPSFDGPGR